MWGRGSWCWKVGGDFVFEMRLGFWFWKCGYDGWD